MKTNEVKYLLQQYFNGESTLEEEKQLESYFSSGNVDDELKEYREFFGGVELLTKVDGEDTIEEDVMKYIEQNENSRRVRFSGTMKLITGIAASVIIILGSYLIYDQQQQPYQDTFDNPQMAYAQAKEALSYISVKYNQGLEELSQFNKLETATEPLEEGVKPVNKAFSKIENLNSTEE